jgi:cell division septation protein DedD
MVSAGCGGRQADWEAARKADSAEAYQQFLQRYPDGDFTSQAKARIEDLREEADWKAALATDTAAGYQQFLGLHPDGARADEARIRVENLNLAQAPVDAPQGSASEAAPPTAAAPGKPAAPSKPVVAPKPAVASKPVVQPGNHIAAAPAGKYRVQLGAFSSATRARSEWQAAVKNHHTLLAGLSYTLDKVTSGKNTLFRLQSTAVTESRARSICAALKTAKQDCVVVLP